MSQRSASELARRIAAPYNDDALEGRIASAIEQRDAEHKKVVEFEADCKETAIKLKLDMQAERDQLRAENARLREALEYVEEWTSERSIEDYVMAALSPERRR